MTIVAMLEFLAVTYDTGWGENLIDFMIEIIDQILTTFRVLNLSMFLKN